VPRPRTIDDDAVLAATARLVGRLGPAKLSLARVAEETGLAPATLVQRFGSKRELLLALARRGTSTWEALDRATDPAAGSAVDAIVGALTNAVAHIGTPEAMANNIAFLQIDLTDPEFHALALQGAQSMREHLRRALDAAVARNELAPTDTDQLADLTQTVYNGALISWAIDRDGPIQEYLATRLRALLARYAAAAPPG
jgi:AcrR family transcriptional regulator